MKTCVRYENKLKGIRPTGHKILEAVVLMFMVVVIVALIPSASFNVFAAIYGESIRIWCGFDSISIEHCHHEANQVANGLGKLALIQKVPVIGPMSLLTLS